MEISKEVNKTIEELQILDQHLQNFLAQKQNMQIELQEIENALLEIEKSGEEVYKVLSGIMIKADKDIIKKELEEKKKLFELRIDSIEKQEKILSDRASEMKEKIHGVVNKK